VLFLFELDDIYSEKQATFGHKNLMVFSDFHALDIQIFRIYYKNKETRI